MKKLQILIPQWKETEDIIKPLLDSIELQQNVDLKNQFTKEELLELKKANLSIFYEFITKIEHSFSISDLYQIYLDANKNEFQYEIHSLTYFKINDTYIPIAYPLNGLSKVITE